MIEIVKSCNHLEVHPDNLQVCLVYPGDRKSGLSSLSVHNLYSLINSIDGISCDIFFLDSNHSVFLNKHLQHFDLLAFSITYENHLIDSVKLLSQHGIPPLRKERDESFPLIIAGGIGVSYNPSPFMPVFDCIYLGESEGRIEDIFKNFPKEKREQIEHLRGFDNVVISKEYSFEYEGDFIKDIRGEKKKIFKSKLFSKYPSHSCFISDETEFRNMYLIELNRGCYQMCKFCVAAYVGLPYREREFGIVESEIMDAGNYTGKVGLIGAGVTDYSKLNLVYEALKKTNVKASFSSLKASSKSEYIFKIISYSEQKTATIAPETGNENLRFSINKTVKDDEYFKFCDKLLSSGIQNIKLYFLIGLPGESLKDIESIIEMVSSFREIALNHWKERGKAGKITVSVNPLIPKPFTPFQWYGLIRKPEIEKRVKLLRKGLSKIPNVHLSVESIKLSLIQAVISRGDTRIGNAIAKGGNLRAALKKIGLDFEKLYSRERSKDEILPWDFVESGLSKEYLWKIYKA